MSEDLPQPSRRPLRYLNWMLWGWKASR